MGKNAFPHSLSVFSTRTPTSMLFSSRDRQRAGNKIKLRLIYFSFFWVLTFQREVMKNLKEIAGVWKCCLNSVLSLEGSP